MDCSPELEELTRRLYDAVVNGDSAFFEHHLASGQNCVVIGTAPDEWWEDHTSAVHAIRRQMETARDAIGLVAGDLRAYRHGDVGWVADRPVFSLGGIRVACRHTSVFVREAGQWRIVQHHFSIGVANQDAFGDVAAKLG